MNIQEHMGISYITKKLVHLEMATFTSFFTHLNTVLLNYQRPKVEKFYDKKYKLPAIKCFNKYQQKSPIHHEILLQNFHLDAQSFFETSSDVMGIDK